MPTPYTELNDLLRELVRSVREILQANFVGAYLQAHSLPESMIAKAISTTF